MIRSEVEHREAVTRVEEDRRFIQLQREALEAKGYAPHEVAAGLEPALAFHEQLADEVAWYERRSATTSNRSRISRASEGS